MKRIGTMVMTTLLLAACRVAAAEAAVAESAPAAQVQVRSLRDIIHEGGLTMEVIIGMSIFATFLAILFVFSLRANVLYPRSFLREAEEAAEEGDIEALRAVCQNSGSAAARIIEAAVEMIAGAPQVDYVLVRDAVEDEGARQAGSLWQRIQYLMDVAVISPMLGLLGTVIGMMEAFSGLEVRLGTVKPTILAQGVAKAMITTVGGLIVGIGAMVLYAYFRGRVNKLIGGLDSACNRVLRKYLKTRSGVRS
jgi:biopolymer transport protein ExbB